MDKKGIGVVQVDWLIRMLPIPGWRLDRLRIHRDDWMAIKDGRGRICPSLPEQDGVPPLKSLTNPNHPSETKKTAPFASAKIDSIRLFEVEMKQVCGKVGEVSACG